jgi:hypothetical protein
MMLTDDVLVQWRQDPSAFIARFQCHAVSHSPPGGQTTLAYHIVRVVVQHSKIGWRSSEMGHFSP